MLEALWCDGSSRGCRRTSIALKGSCSLRDTPDGAGWGVAAHLRVSMSTSGSAKQGGISSGTSCYCSKCLLCVDVDFCVKLRGSDIEGKIHSVPFNWQR